LSVIVIVSIAPPEIVQVAVAVVIEPAPIVIVGGLVYPTPAKSIFKETT
jgi:hypothetical protein